jgi:long-chain acyl-CoA synthetase
MIDQDTSAYWRKHLQLDEPLPPDLLGQYRTWHRFLRSFFYAVVSAALRIYCPVKVSGLANLPEKPPYILAANHASAMDYVCVAWALGRRKEELYPITTKLFYDVAWARFWIKVAANAVRIDTVEDFFPALRVAARILRAGGAVYINPEGTRSTNGRLLPFRPGVGVLAVETQVPLVPVHVGGTWQALPTGSIFPKPRPVSVAFGQPISMKEYGRRKHQEQAYDVYKEVTAELRQRVQSLSQ